MSKTRLQNIMSSLQAGLSGYFGDLWAITQDITLPYRHFVHWNISKILIFLYANVGGFVLALPFIIGIVAQWLTVYSSIPTSAGAYPFLMEHVWSIVLTIILFIGVVTAFVATYTYGYFLLLRVYRGYTTGETLPYFKNLYFSWEHFRVYMGIVGWIGLYLLLPMLLFCLLAIPFMIAIQMGALDTLTQWVDGNLMIGFISILVFIGLIVWFFSLAIRLVFASFVFACDNTIARAKSYIDTSFALTKGKVWRIVFWILPFLIFIAVIASMGQYAERSINTSRIYPHLQAEQTRSSQDDHALIKKYLYPDSDIYADHEQIAQRFPVQKNSIDRDFLFASIDHIDIKRIDGSWWIFSTLFVVLSYLLLEGINAMIYFGVYRVLIRKTDQNPTIPSDE